MLFAEVFSGASQTWFINGWGMLITFPLYLAHVLFFLWIALKLKKISMFQLYLFGILFALYESWITKVLWSGYMDSTGPGMGTILGVGILEFPVLVFFWHPIMSFILPILVFEILTNSVISEHGIILEKSNKKTAVIILFSIAISTFIANGNRFDLLSTNISLIGTLLIVSGLYYPSKKKDLKVFEFGEVGFGIVTIYLILLYITTFFLLLSERIPEAAVPFITILAFYTIPIFLIIRSKKTDIQFNTLTINQYSSKDLIKFAFVTIFAANLACLIPNISQIILAITYYSLTIIGIIIFIFTGYRVFKQSFSKN